MEVVHELETSGLFIAQKLLTLEKQKKQLLYLQPRNDHVRHKNHKFSFIILKSKAGLQRLWLCLKS